MKLWPIITITPAFILAAFAAKISSPIPVMEPFVEAMEQQETSIIAKRTGLNETSDILSASNLEKVSFQSIGDGKVTPVARKIVALTGTHFVSVENALITHEEATGSPGRAACT